MYRSTLLGSSLAGGACRARLYAWVQAEHIPLLVDLVPATELGGEGFWGVACTGLRPVLQMLTVVRDILMQPCSSQ